MSYESMARDETCCDFPHHRHADFDTTVGARCAILRNGVILAFCRFHSEILLCSGVALISLVEARAAYNALRGDQPQLPSEEVRARREEAFIASLR